jgi:hypothetical protein
MALAKETNYGSNVTIDGVLEFMTSMMQMKPCIIRL